MLIGFVAGEASGDLLAAPVIAALRQRLPNAQFAGIAGDRMTEAGATAWWHVRELSVRGYAEVLRELPRLLRMADEVPASAADLRALADFVRSSTRGIVR